MLNKCFCSENNSFEGTIQITLVALEPIFRCVNFFKYTFCLGSSENTWGRWRRGKTQYCTIKHLKNLLSSFLLLSTYSTQEATCSSQNLSDSFSTATHALTVKYLVLIFTLLHLALTAYPYRVLTLFSGNRISPFLLLLKRRISI